MSTAAHFRPGPRRAPVGPALSGLLATIAACTAGPDFEAPAPPAVRHYLAGPEPTETVSADGASGHAQRFVRDRDVPAEWWSLFESPALDALVRQALEDSPRLAQVQAKLVRAQEELRGRTGATTYPTVGVSGSAFHVGVDSGAAKAGTLAQDFPLTLVAGSVDVAYTLDLFGRDRRELEALRARVDYERFEREAARLMLAGNVVTAAIEEASLRRQLESTEAVLALQVRRLGIVQQLERLGSASELDVVERNREVVSTRSNLAPLRQRLEQTRHRLAVYLGQPPGAARLPELRFETDLRLPAELPLSLPAELARRRPDVLAAEALLHEASARVGVAAANFYPQLTLSAKGGVLSIDQLLDGAAWFSLLSASITQPLFRGGELDAEEQAATAAFDQATAAYGEVVLEALREVADVLVALDTDARVLRERTEAARLAATAHEITSKQYESGGVSLLALLEAERQHLAATVDETRAIADRFADTAALFQALGGGWWNASPPAEPSQR